VPWHLGQLREVLEVQGVLELGMAIRERPGASERDRAADRADQMDDALLAARVVSGRK
jgi:hypothetical protein